MDQLATRNLICSVTYSSVSVEESSPKWAAESGQTLIEYVLATGILVLLGISLSGIVTRALRVFVSALMWELSFLSP